MVRDLCEIFVRVVDIFLRSSIQLICPQRGGPGTAGHRKPVRQNVCQIVTHFLSGFAEGATQGRHSDKAAIKKSKKLTKIVDELGRMCYSVVIHFEKRFKELVTQICGQEGHSAALIQNSSGCPEQEP